MSTLKIVMIALACVFSVNLFAGGSQPAPVFTEVYDDGSVFASGDMWTARSSKNDVEIIGCGIKQFADSTGFPDWGFCQARDENDQYVVCFTEAVDILEAIYAVNDSSFIQFDGDPDGECLRIGVSSQSFYLPLTTTKGSN